MDDGAWALIEISATAVPGFGLDVAAVVDEFYLAADGYRRAVLVVGLASDIGAGMPRRLLLGRLVRRPAGS